MANKLNKQAFDFMPVGELHPAGWLKRQLRIQADGLSGNLDKFWPDIRDSKWIGGTAEGWERVPYWLDGFIPLAWLLNDEDLKKRASYYVNYIIEHQAEDGWICPEHTAERKSYDVWALFLILKALVVYHDATGDARILNVVRNALLALDKHIDTCTLFNWGQTRWFECLISIWWLYEKTGEEWLIMLASKLHSQGFDWKALFESWPYTTPQRGRWSYMSHVVNNAMMLKAGALWWRLTGMQEDLASPLQQMKLLDEYHGMVTGVFSGDECLIGKSPVQGTELCAVVEYMYSLEHLLAITGEAHWADRLELIAFNALPATFSSDMWTHQYDQQVNQVMCVRQDKPSIFATNGIESNLFGLEPNYGCCTANLSQGWPKLALSTFLRSEAGIAAAVYMPGKTDTVISGVKATFELQTEYPFSEVLNFTIKTEEEVDFSLFLRIPEWAEKATITIITGNEKEEAYPQSGSFHELKRKWKGETAVTLRLPMKTILVKRPSSLYAVRRGPLIYSLAISERWVRTNENITGREFPHCDYEVFPESAWNYGLIADVENLDKSLVFETRPIGDYPFSPQGVPVLIRAKGKKVDWPEANKSAAASPRLDWISDEVEELVLIPYGATTLRLTEMPLV